MDLWSEQVCKARDIKAGHLYIDKNSCVMDYDCIRVEVCIGKMLKGETSAVFEFLELDLELTEWNLANKGKEAVSKAIKQGYKIQNVIMLSYFGTKTNALVDCGEFIAATKIPQWLAQLKLSGCTFSIDADVYIGDWKQRKKYPTVRGKGFVEKRFYIKEELAYWRYDTHRLKQSDNVYFFWGSVRQVYLLWFKMSGCDVDRFINSLDTSGIEPQFNTGHKFMLTLDKQFLARNPSNMFLLDDKWTVGKER